MTDTATQSQSALESLALILTPEVMVTLEALEWCHLKPIYEGYAERIAEKQRAGALTEKRSEALTAHFIPQDLPSLTLEGLTARLDAQAEVIGDFQKGNPLHRFKAEEDRFAETPRNKKWDIIGKRLPTLKITNQFLIQKVLDLIDSEIVVAGEKFDAEHLPKPKVAVKSSTGRTRRTADAFDITITNTPETAQGKEYEYVFVGDEDTTYLKDGKITKGAEGEKDKKKQTYRAVKKDKPFMPKKSEDLYGQCFGAISWDRSLGSEAIKVSKGKFRMLCPETDLYEGGGDSVGWCKKCAVKKENFWRGKYGAALKETGAVRAEEWCVFIDQNSNGNEYTAEEIKARQDA